MICDPLLNGRFQTDECAEDAILYNTYIGWSVTDSCMLSSPLKTSLGLLPEQRSQVFPSMKAISLLSLATLQAVALANSQPLHERLHSRSFTILNNNTLVCEHVFD